MLPATPDILQCPRCGRLLLISSIMSGNTYGMVQWSDAKRHTPMLLRDKLNQILRRKQEEEDWEEDDDVDDIIWEEEEDDAPLF